MEHNMQGRAVVNAVMMEMQKSQQLNYDMEVFVRLPGGHENPGWTYKALKEIMERYNSLERMKEADRKQKRYAEQVPPQARRLPARRIARRRNWASDVPMSGHEGRER